MSAFSHDTRGGVFPRDTRRRKLILDIAAVIALCLISVVFLAPFLWMLSSSLKSLGEIYEFPPRFIPEAWRWSNYVDAWNAVPFGRFFVNSLVVSVLTTIGAVLTSSLAGYSFARLRYPGRDRIFLAYLGTMMVPFPVLMVPLFMVMRELHLVDSLASLILPGIFTAWGTFLMRQFMLGLPTEIEDAAKIDGCGYFGLYWRIALPLVRPVIVTLAIFTFLSSWNEFLWPLIMINSIDHKTLPLKVVP